MHIDIFAKKKDKSLDAQGRSRLKRQPGQDKNQVQLAPEDDSDENLIIG